MYLAVSNDSNAVPLCRSAQAVAGAPQLLTMRVEAVQARHELLASLAALQPSWASQLAEASKETLAVWLCSRCGCLLDVLLALVVVAALRRLACVLLFVGRWCDVIEALLCLPVSVGGRRDTRGADIRQSVALQQVRLLMYCWLGVGAALSGPHACGLRHLGVEQGHAGGVALQHVRRFCVMSLKRCCVCQQV
jgi:hypothetical protein